jgi:hypothetical protein
MFEFRPMENEELELISPLHSDLSIAFMDQVDTNDLFLIGAFDEARLIGFFASNKKTEESILVVKQTYLQLRVSNHLLQHASFAYPPHEIYIASTVVSGYFEHHENSNQLDIDPCILDTNDPLHLIPQMLQNTLFKRNCAKKVTELFHSLTQEEIHRLSEYALSFKHHDSHLTFTILLSLICFRQTSIEDNYLMKLFHNKGFHFDNLPLLLGASKNVKDLIINESHLPSMNDDHFSVLAWILDDRVTQLFYECWVKQTLTLLHFAGDKNLIHQFKKMIIQQNDKIHVNFSRNKIYEVINHPVEEYTSSAGWILTSEGKRENLFFDVCYPFNDQEKEVTTIDIIGVQDECCPWCNAKLTKLFDIHLQDALFQFLKTDGKRLIISTCCFCTCYGVIYARFDHEGNSAWYEFNQKPDYLPDHQNQNEVFEKTKRLELSPKKRNPYYAASQFLDTTFTQLGGFPTWIQRAEYPKCPECGTLMKFLGQIHGGETNDQFTGTYYTFICDDCSISATSYQQT